MRLLTDGADLEGLLEKAAEAMRLAYSPYSGHRVGAALLTRDGTVYLGANIGNACSTLNCCAEQVALNQAVMSGKTAFVAIAVVQSSGQPCPPCGRCLQLLAEFADDMIIATRDDGTLREWPLKYLLPVPFKRDS